MLHFWFQILKNRNDRGGYEHNMKHSLQQSLESNFSEPISSSLGGRVLQWIIQLQDFFPFENI